MPFRNSIARKVLLFALVVAMCAAAMFLVREKAPATTQVAAAQKRSLVTSARDVEPRPVNPALDHLARLPEKGEARGAYLRDWIASDRAGAVAYLKGTYYADLSDGVVAYAFAQGATAAELIDMVNNTGSPAFQLAKVGVYMDPALLNVLGGSLGAFAEAKQPQVAMALASLFANWNTGRAESFASGLPEGNLKNQAYAGVIQTLKGSSNGAAEIQSLYQSLPQGIRDSDSIRYAYGTAGWGADPEAALGVLSGITDPETKQKAMLTFAREVRSQAPVAAIGALYASGMPREAVVGQASTVLRIWSHVDPAAAAAYLDAHPALPAGDAQAFRDALATGPKG